MTDNATRTHANPLQPRATSYAGIAMRSRLEARYAAWLDREKIPWSYEPRCYANADGQYLPDFRLDGIMILGEPRTLYVDTKPTIGSTRDTLQRMTIIWATEPDAWLAVESPARRESTITVMAPEPVGRLTINFTWARTAPDWKPALARDMTAGRWAV